MRFRKSIWVLLIIVSFSLMGVAYSAWEEEISVKTKIKSAEFDGVFKYLSYDEKVINNEVDFMNEYEVMVKRSKSYSQPKAIKVSDSIVVKNSSSIPAKYYVKPDKSKMKASITFNYVVEEVVVQETKVIESQEVISDDGVITTVDVEVTKPLETVSSYDVTETIDLPLDQFVFILKMDGDKSDEMSYGEFVDSLDDALCQGIDVKSKEKIEVIEKWNGDISDYVKTVDDKGNTVKSYTYSVDWEYFYKVKQVPFNQ